MTGERTARLVRMADQIAASVPVPARAADQTATHLRTFWAPAMIDDLAAVARADSGAVSPAVREALAALRPSEPAHG
jgi:hypothetical protein